MSLITKELKWDEKRSMIALTLLQRGGMTWIDDQVRIDKQFLQRLMLCMLRIRPLSSRIFSRALPLLAHTVNDVSAYN